MKKVTIISVGKRHDVSVKAGIDEYTTRVKRYLPLDWVLIPSSDVKTEGEAILKAVSKEDFCIVLDEEGVMYTSIKLAELVDERLTSSDKRIVFIIGGAYGFSSKVQDRANVVWSLGKLTFPHQLVRLLLVEQIYRTLTIIKGEKYHHAG